MAENTLEGLKNQDDVNPSEELEKLVKKEEEGRAPKTTGTGSNHSVPAPESLIIKRDNPDSGDDSGETSGG